MELNAISQKEQSYQGFVVPLQNQLKNIIEKAIADGPRALANLPSSGNVFKKTYRKKSTKKGTFKKKSS
jgi:DNA topoisomerase-3